jgi:hypothetical protein
MLAGMKRRNKYRYYVAGIRASDDSPAIKTAALNFEEPLFFNPAAGDYFTISA